MAGGLCPHRGPHGVAFDRARAEQARGLGFAHPGPGASLPHGSMSKVRREAAGISLGSVFRLVLCGGC